MYHVRFANKLGAYRNSIRKMVRRKMRLFLLDVELLLIFIFSLEVGCISQQRSPDRADIPKFDLKVPSP